VTVIFGETNNIVKYFNDYPVYYDDGIGYYEGFDLMRPAFFNNYDLGHTPEVGCQYLLRLGEDGEVIGVIKWKRYGLPDHQFVSEGEKNEVNNYIAIRFVDVHENHRRKGVAKELVVALSQRLDDECIVGGQATPSGRKCNIHLWMKECFSQKYYISEVKLLDEWEEENCEW
jgi:GNAT superfamily N-acetyltransferase